MSAIPAADDRYRELVAWARACIQDPTARVLPASSDASFRRYFRVVSREVRIVMDAPPEREGCTAWIDIAARLCAAGIRAPRIYAQDVARGFLLIEDLGDTSYLDALDTATVEPLYAAAFDTLLRMQSAVDSAGLPVFDADLLRREMELFRDWLLGRHLQLALGGPESEMLTQSFDFLCRVALEQPRVFVHRDYHSRNLMVPPPGEDRPGVLDFQDAVLGPVTYDLVSLLRDCYVAWPWSRVREWALEYLGSVSRAGVVPAVDEGTWLRWFDLMGVQRHLKASGIFCRLLHRDGKPGYLADVPRTVGYMVEACARHSELAGLGSLIERRVLPALEAAVA